MRAPPEARREPAEVQNRPPSVLYIFEHKTKYILIHAPHGYPHRGILTYQ